MPAPEDARLARDELDGALRNAGDAREELDERLIGLPVDGRRLQGDFEPLAVLAHHAAALRAGLHVQRHGDARLRGDAPAVGRGKQFN